VAENTRVVLKLYARCLVAFDTFFLKVVVMRVAILGFFGNSQFIS